MRISILLVGVVAVLATFACSPSSAPSSLAESQAIEVKDANLPPYSIIGYGIPKPLTEKHGNAVDGRKAVVGQRLGNCLACHKLPIPEEQFHGEIGPDLHGVGGRLPESILRLRVVDPKRFNPGTPMPSFYKVDGLHRVSKDRAGNTILSAQQVEDIVAYLRTLK